MSPEKHAHIFDEEAGLPKLRLWLISRGSRLFVFIIDQFLYIKIISWPLDIREKDNRNSLEDKGWIIDFFFNSPGPGCSKAG